MRTLAIKKWLVPTLLFGIWCLASRSTADAPPGRYAVSGGVVTDTKTGLHWTQSFSPETHIWDASGSTGSAQNYCSTMSGGPWRLPSLNELMTLVDFTVAANDSSVTPIDPIAFPATPVPNYFVVWTSTPGQVPGQPGTPGAYYVAFNYGFSNVLMASQPSYVICVH